jgi:two-component system, sensor histidine kinase
MGLQDNLGIISSSQSTGSSSQSTGSGTAPPTEKNARSSVLIVDDVEINRIILRQYLINTPFEADEAENGAIAVAKVKQRSYDFILMDLLMPEMDGFEAMRNIRIWEESHGAERACVIITHTAWELKEAIAECFSSGADLHLTKPIAKAKLLEVLNMRWSRIIRVVQLDPK